MGLKKSRRTVLDRFGFKGRLVFHSLYRRSSWAPVSLMWCWSDLMTITVARFVSAALSRELLPIFCLVQKMFPIMFLLPLSFSWQIIRYGSSWGPQAELAGLYTNLLHPSPFFFDFCLSVPFSIQFCLYSDVKVKRWTGLRALLAHYTV